MQAYNLKALLAKLEAKGITLGEEALKTVVGETLDWVGESAKASATPLDDILAVVAPHAKSAIMPLLDLNRDGQVGVSGAH